jgi:Flp pilus assembly pilin Flp
MRSGPSQPGRAHHHERGASVIEYSLLIALIAVAIIASVSFLSSSISDTFLAAGEPFATAQTAGPGSPAQVRAGKSVTLDLAQLSGVKDLKDVKVTAMVDPRSGRVEGKDNGTIKFEAGDRATGTARITYTYSYKQGAQTVRGEGSTLVDIVR